MTAAEEAKARFADAARVLGVYAGLVVRCRTAWRAAPAGKPADRARLALARAIQQQAAADVIYRDTWKAWHALRSPET